MVEEDEGGYRKGVGWGYDSRGHEETRIVGDTFLCLLSKSFSLDRYKLGTNQSMDIKLIAQVRKDIHTVKTFDSNRD